MHVSLLRHGLPMVQRWKIVRKKIEPKYFYICQDTGYFCQDIICIREDTGFLGEDIWELVIRTKQVEGTKIGCKCDIPESELFFETNTPVVQGRQFLNDCD